MKDTICTVIGLIGGTIAALFGGWDTALQTLVIFMAIDYITGLVVAGVFHASPKTKTGALESKAGWKGLIRKGETLLIVLVACQLDAVIGGSFVRDAAIIGFSANEAISIVENAGLMGLPIPAAITKAIDILKQRAETPEKARIEMKKKISAGTLTRTAALGLALTNQLLSAAGKPCCPSTMPSSSSSSPPGLPSALRWPHGGRTTASPRPHWQAMRSMRGRRRG